MGFAMPMKFRAVKIPLPAITISRRQILPRASFPLDVNLAVVKRMVQALFWPMTKTPMASAMQMK